MLRRIVIILVLIAGFAIYPSKAKFDLDSLDYLNSTITQITDFDGDLQLDTLISLRNDGIHYPYYVA